MADETAVQDGATGTQTTPETTAAPPENPPAPAATPQIDAAELASLREKASKYDELAPWTPAVATLQKKGVRPVDVMAGYSPGAATQDAPAGGPPAKPDHTADTATLVRSVVSEQFAVQQHTLESKGEERLISEIESEIDALSVADAVKPLLKDALYKRVQESRAKSFYPAGHPLASKYHAPLGEAAVGELRKWANHQATALGAKALVGAGKSAIAARTIAGQVTPAGAPNTKPTRPGLPDRNTAVEAMKQIRLQLAGDTVGALAG